MFLHIRDKYLPVLTDTWATLLVLNPNTIKQSLPQSTKTVQLVGIFNELQEVPLSEPTLFCIGPLRDRYSFLLSSSASIYFLGGGFLEKYHAKISFSPKGEIILDINK